MAAAAPLHIEAVRKGDRVIAYEVLQVDLARSDNDHYARRMIARFDVGADGVDAARHRARLFVERRRAAGLAP